MASVELGSESIMGDPTPEGRFGRFGGQYVPETLVPACQELEKAFRSAWGDADFRAELGSLLADYACLLYTSPSPRDATLSRMPSSA